MLPILTLDEARLSPSHGYILNRRWLRPHESILGIEWKLARMNALPCHIVAQQLALRPIDPYEGIPPSTAMLPCRSWPEASRFPRRGWRIACKRLMVGSRCTIAFVSAQRAWRWRVTG